MTERQVNEMTEEKKRDLAEMIKILEQLSPASYRLTKNNAELLRARDAMDTEIKKTG